MGSQRGRAKGSSERREPSFEAPRARPGSAGDLVARPEDRAVPTRKAKRQKAAAAGTGKPTARVGERPERRDPSRRRSTLGRLVYWGFVLGLWIAVGVAGLVGYHATKLPPIDQLSVPKRPPNIAILAADGSLLANRGETGGREVRLSELPAYLPAAFLAIEDHRFQSHWGVDPVGIARAVISNVVLRRGGMQGGSTLTQQLAKNLFLTQERTASRKIQEAILALWLERKFSKDQILELYLNRVYFGSGAYGVEAASLRYFGKPARAVGHSEAAMLAGLVQAPSRLAPNRNLEGARERAALVLAAMYREGVIDDKALRTALDKPASAGRGHSAGSGNYAADAVMDVLDDFVGPVESDIVVQTSIDPKLQAAAERALADELDAKGAKGGVSQGAIVSLGPDGAVRALVGGRDYSHSQFNRAVTAKRQPGSAFKPFVFLAALDRGLTPDTVRDDAPVSIRGYNPENYSREYFGPVTLTKALALSLNTVAVRLGQEVGPRAMARTAQRLGIGSKMEANASLALGTSEVSPIELAGAYAPFANGGEGVVPHMILRVRTTAGATLYARPPGRLGRVVEPDQVAMMNAMLRETLLVGTARKADLPGWEAAGKTGTSQEFRDAWFVGYTARLVTAVWLGNDDGTPTRRVSGGGLPVEVWSRFMKTAHAGIVPVALPGGRWRVMPVELEAQMPVEAAAPATSRRAAAGQEQRTGYPPRERNVLERLFGG